MNNFDICLVNPPYGRIGAEITKFIIDNVEFNEYVNLMPANDYRKYVKRLYNYASDMVPVNNGFADATVTTQIAKIHKSPVNNMTDGEFEISTYIDPQLDKYFKENNKRTHYAIDEFDYRPKIEKFKAVDIAKTLYIGKRDVNHCHLPYSANSITAMVNFNKLDNKKILDMSSKSEQLRGRAGAFELVIFDTETEKKNIVDFMYSKNGFRFMSKMFTSMNIDGWTASNKYLPKVDWTRSWTVEEILADYGYTPDEIQAVMDDLNRFKYMKS